MSAPTQLPTPKERNWASMSGILTAIAILALFVCTAALLPSVFFGFLLAFFILPVQQFFERRLFLHPRYLNLIRARDHLRSKISIKPGDATPPELQVRTAVASHSAIFTSVLVFVFIATVSFVLFSVSVNSVDRIGTSIRTFSNSLVDSEYQRVRELHKSDSMIVLEIGKDSPILALTDSEVVTQNYIETFTSAIIQKVQVYRAQLNGIEELRPIMKEVNDLLQSKNSHEQFAQWLLEKVNNYFPFLFGALRSSIQLAISGVLMLLFFVLFLQIFAKAIARAQFYNEEEKRLGNYLTTLLFATDWFPNLPVAAREESAEIINTVIDKIRIWLRGYFTIVLIEIPIYVLAFSCIGVPYPVVLGIVCSCTILLPVVGPVITFPITFLVVAFSQDVSALQLVLLLVTCLLVWGVLETLILYPRMIGYKLGLNFLETFAVVLLGAYLFGVLGLLLALPITSVLKYLIPKIWVCWMGVKEPNALYTQDSA